eukprot:CAMPEP_0184646124 /NCGR_PEP_ID=MMETSP0308-20130426/2763_1 /TAXON_ID=38269 /ORGANISM="Gloeochaete witrockiana, Strain SAG 46.84" /LENGTH=480 /DNA_ID=CAMNT_0027075825 /DNA_START=104 /DNA_END=1546 /DNA_ORIENTATION=+
MYQISTRPYLYELSRKQKVESLADVPDEMLDKLKAAGITIVWFMGVWKLGEIGLNFDRNYPPLLKAYSEDLPGYTKDDIIGSPYSIVEYTCHPDIGTDDDIAKLRDRLHSRDMRLMLDFVPNHTARDGTLKEKGLDYYVREAKGRGRDTNRFDADGVAYGSDPNYPGGWKDTSQLNYWNPDTWKFQVDTLLHIAALCDGIRCDMAMLCMNDVIQRTWGEELASNGYKRPQAEFWKEAISTVKAKFPQVIFLAECYWDTEAALHGLGFDFTYDKALYDRLEHFHLQNLRDYITSKPVEYHFKSAHFTENHDEPRAVRQFKSIPAANAAALISMTMPGMRFHHHGQWQGFSNRLRVHLRRSADEPVHPEVEAFYAKLCDATAADVFHKGKWTYLNVKGDNSWRFVGWRWEYEDEKRAIIVNYSDQMADARLPLDNASARDGKDDIEVEDLLTGNKFVRSAKEMASAGLHVVLGPFTGHIFKY